MEFDWDPEKNEFIRAERGVTFEEIVLSLGNGKLWKIGNHYNQQRYPKQRIFFVQIDGYIFMVPFVVENDVIFLKTAFASRKATKEFIEERK